MAGSPLPHDLRLATAVSVAWLSAAIGVAGTGRRALLMAVAAGAVGLVALAASRRGRQLASVLAMSAFCAALLLAPLAARLANAGNSPLAALARQRVELTAELTVTADPRSLAATGVAGSPRAAVDAEVTGVTVAGQRERARGAVLVLGPAALWRDVLPGQRVRLDVRAQPPLPGNLLVATFAAQSDPVLLGSPPWWQRAAGRVRGSMRQAASGLPGDASGLLPGLVDGDTAGLDPVLAEHFQLAGLTHLVAVSGANCAILLGAVLLVLRRLRCGPRTCALVGVLVLVAFVVVARPSPSVLRAAAMAALALYGLATGRERGTLPALSAAVLGLLLWQPELAASAGFAMSVLATGALLMVAPGWADALARRRVPSWLAGPLAVAAAAHLVTAPVVAAISGKVSLVAVPANLLAEPVMGAVTVLGFCAAATAPFSEGAGTVFAWLAGWPCRWLIGVANFFGGMHGATLPWPAGV
ncbi:MAG TPA: ComEC/Rec2 family competence protein, partial [Jatrophihabitantaceae bacterium]|nr:ComEC/Rec2 family competence protein [Jatrophihabitantaceae bacterium]